MRDRNYYGCMMVETGDADAMISGFLKTILIQSGLHYILLVWKKALKSGRHVYYHDKKGPLFLADTTVNFNPTAEELADITLLVAKEVKHFESHHA